MSCCPDNNTDNRPDNHPDKHIGNRRTYINNNFYIFCLLFICYWLLACSTPQTSDEQQIRQYIETAKLAAEAGSYNDLADLIHADYRDQQSLDKQKIKHMLRAYLFTHKNIYLLTKITSIDFQENNRVFVTLYVAMTGKSTADINALSSLRARVYQFDLLLIKEDYSWLLQQAKWQQTSLQNMLQ